MSTQMEVLDLWDSYLPDSDYPSSQYLGALEAYPIRDIESAFYGLDCTGTADQTAGRIIDYLEAKKRCQNTFRLVEFDV